MVAAARSRIESLDGIRGLCLLLVVFTHSESVFFRQPMEAVNLHHGPGALLLSGEAAVTMFFLLSGYVLARSASRSGEWVDTAFFFVRRIFRIHPPYMAALLLAWLASYTYSPTVGGPALSHTITESRAVQLGVDRLLQSFLFPGPAYGQLVPGWTLRVEMIYSLALPLMLWIANRSHWSVMLLLSLGLMTLGDGEHPTEWFAVHFSVGAILYLERDRLAKIMNALPGFAHLAVCVIGVGVFAYPEYALMKYESPRGALGLYVVGSVLLMLSAIHTHPVRYAMSTRPMQMLGRISYSVYLLHMPVILLCLPFARELPEPWMSWLAFGIPMAIVSCAVGWVFERGFDRYSTRAGHQVCGWLSQFRKPSAD